MMAMHIVTGNRLGDGRVVYLTKSGSWSERISNGAIARKDEERIRLEAMAAHGVGSCEVVEPYAIEVVEADDTIRPVRYREYIRAEGPSIHPHFGRGNFVGSGAI